MKIVKTEKMQGFNTQNSLFSLTPMCLRRNADETIRRYCLRSNVHRRNELMAALRTYQYVYPANHCTETAGAF